MCTLNIRVLGGWVGEGGLGGDKAPKEPSVQDQRRRKKTPPTYLRWERDRPIDLASSWEITIILKAFVFMASS